MDDCDAYFDAYARELARQFNPNIAIKQFADNTAVIGAFAEAAVMKFVRSYIEPIRVSTGTVISPEIFKNPKDVPQLDSILWSPCPLPAIFDVNDFALVPRMSCLGALEVKRSAYSDVPEKMAGFLDKAKQLVRPLQEFEPAYD